MQVTVNIRKRDVIWLSMQVFYRSSLTRWVTFALLLLNAVVFYRKGYSGLESMLFGTIMSIFCMALGWRCRRLLCSTKVDAAKGCWDSTIIVLSPKGSLSARR